MATTILFDTFDAPSGLLHTNLTSWRKVTGVTGNMTLSGDGNVYHSSGTTPAAYYNINAVPSTPDYSVFGKVLFTNTNNTYSGGVCGRMATNTQTLYWARFQGNAVGLLRIVSGSATTLGGGAVAFPMTTGTEAEIELRMAGTQISVYVNGNLMIGPITDTGITAAGYPGIRTINGGSHIRINEVRAVEGSAEVEPPTPVYNAAQFFTMF